MRRFLIFWRNTFKKHPEHFQEASGTRVEKPWDRETEELPAQMFHRGSTVVYFVSSDHLRKDRWCFQLNQQMKKDKSIG